MTRSASGTIVARFESMTRIRAGSSGTAMPRSASQAAGPISINCRVVCLRHLGLSSGTSRTRPPRAGDSHHDTARSPDGLDHLERGHLLEVGDEVGLLVLLQGPPAPGEPSLLQLGPG